MRARSFAPFVALAVSGCLASKSDVVLLQNDLRTMRDASAQAAAAQRAHIDQVLAQITRTNDSVRMLSARLAKLRARIYGLGRTSVPLAFRVSNSARRFSW